MRCDPKDRHVLAAAVRGGAERVVTFNLKDFPVGAGAEYGVAITDPDAFLCQLLVEDVGTVIATLEREAAALASPPERITQFLASLTVTVPVFANLAADALNDLPGPISTVPALVRAEAERSIAAMGEPGDLSNPGQVAVNWWSGLLGELDVARALTYDPKAWGDYQWAIDLLADRSLASKVIYAVDAANQIAFMRFVPEVSAPSEVFEAFLTSMTFMTLVRIQDETWRVWGLGPTVFSARTILGG